MKTFTIFGTVVETDDMRFASEDVTPSQFKAFAETLEDGEKTEILINSPGGSVFGGIAIANMIRQLSLDGHPTVARIEGVAASVASVIMCACDKIIMGESSLVMIHNCWTMVQGDSNTLRKEADTMDTMNEAIISFYLSKFDLSRDKLKELMNQETWFSGREVEEFNFKAEVIPDASGFNIAAKVKGFDLGKFNHTPKAITDLLSANAEAKAEPKAGKLEATIDYFGLGNKPAEAKADEPAEMVTKAEADKRVSGMQSAMAKQIDSLKKDYEARITDFENQLKAKGEELTKAQADVTRLTQSLEDTKRELAETASALADKTNTLAKLNASVLTPQIGQSDAARNWRAAYSAIRRN